MRLQPHDLSPSSRSIPMEDYNRWIFVGWILRLCIVLSLFAVALSLGACATKGVQATASGSVVDPSISTGRSAAGTWNPLPQGGTDEKSNRTPSQSSE